MNICIMNRFRFGFSTQITIKLTHPYSMCSEWCEPESESENENGRLNIILNSVCKIELLHLITISRVQNVLAPHVHQ